MFRKSLNFLKGRFPDFFQVLFRVRDFIRGIPARIQLLRIERSKTSPALVYLGSNFPKHPALRSESVYGGAVKLTYLAETFPHHFPFANVMYAVSSVGHPLQLEILTLAKNKKLKIIVNQNGVAFPAWDGDNYKGSNLHLKALINFSDFIVYQSQFCKDAAELYISPPDVPNEIIYNPVDTRLFSPNAGSAKPRELTLLLGGNQFTKYRLELALQTLSSLQRTVPNAKLIVTGRLWQPHEDAEVWTRQILSELNLTDHVIFTGAYTQVQAPALFARAHALIHTQYADSSPGLVLEALACGLPVIYLNNGGVPELVGDAGIGVPVQHDWDRINLPDPQAMADAALQVYSHRAEYAQKARQRAVENFSLEQFVARHAEIFEKVLDTQ